jgi:endonuclease-3
MSTKRNTGKSRLPKKSAKKKARALELLRLLYTYYPNPHCELDYETPFQLLIATILSAQCTDVRVNQVTKVLFKEYPDAKSMSEAPLEELEELVRPTGFFRNKALSISETSKTLMKTYNGEVPKTMEELLTLRGAARKTANVVLGNAFGMNEGVVVDTHVGRLSNRFGLSSSSNPIIIEQDLMALFPQEEWTNLSHLLILHGRAACKARFAKPSNHEVCIKFGKKCSCKPG